MYDTEASTPSWLKKKNIILFLSLAWRALFEAGA